MQIVRDQPATTKGLAERFTGDVYVDAPAPARSSGGLVHFAPGARTAWHTHPLGRTIDVLEGIGRCQRQGGPIEEIHPGDRDRVFFEPDEQHWHGAAPNRLMTHLALTETADEGEAISWGEKVTDSEYTQEQTS